MRNALQLLERRHVFARVSADAAGGWTAMNSGVTLEVVGRPQVGRKNGSPPNPHAARHLHSYLHINRGFVQFSLALVFLRNALIYGVLTQENRP